MTPREVDLTEEIRVDSPVWPGFPEVSFEPLLTMDKDGVNVATLRFATHVCTHIDAPLHMIEGGLSVDAIPVQELVGTCVLLDATRSPSEPEVYMQGISLDDVRSGDIVIMKTRSGDERKSLTTYRYPNVEIGKILLDKKIKLYCTDAPGVDNPKSSTFPFHKLMLGSGIPIVEGLVNLSSLTSRRFFLIVLPLKLVGLDGSPCRAVAIEGPEF